MKSKNLFFSLILLLVFQLGFSQEGTITGTVSDDKGLPLPSVNVIVKGTSNGVITDFDGNYEISGVNAEDVLVYSYIGFKQKEINVGSQEVIDVTLASDAANLDEVVVVAYGTSTKKDLTGAVSTISSEELNAFPATNVDQALQGKASGVQVTQNSGAPGSSISVNIRGVGTFGNTTPLYVVDGFPTQDISYLNPNNIQSISVLKDASASALYGVRASNGVVIIQTKKGTKGKLQVSVNSWSGVSTPPEKTDVLNASQFANFARNLGESQDKNTLEAWENPENLRNVNWQDYAFRTAFRTGHSVSIRGGGEDLTAALTAGLIDEEGTVLGSSYKRYNVGTNLQYDITDNLHVKGNLRYSYNERKEEVGQGFYNLLKVYTNVPYLSNITGTNVPYDGNGNYGTFGLRLLQGSSNVLGSALRRDSQNGRNVVLGNFGVDWELFDGLTATVNFNFNSQNYSGSSFSPKYEASQNDFNENASFNISDNTSNEYLLESLLEYKKEFGKHSVNLLLGASSQKTRYKNLYVNSQGFLNNRIREILLAETITNTGGTYGTSTLASQFARFNYNYDSKYYITATIRRDGVGDRFGKNNLYGVFPSFAAGWNIDEEAFMENTPFDVLKLRGSWGKTGNFFGIPSFQYLGFYDNGNNNNDAGYVFGSNQDLTQGLQPVSLANPDLQWEEQEQLDIGLEGELFNSRLYFNADYFRKTSSKFLFQQTIPAQTGFQTKSVNGGSVLNQGFEFLVGYRKSQGDFNYDVSVNFTKVENEIKELVGTNDYVIFNSQFAPGFVDNWSGVTRSYEGGNVGTFYGYRADGIFQNQGEIDALNNAAPDGAYQNSATAPGDRKFKDLNGDGKIGGDDREVIGSPIPDFYGGMNFALSYKNWDLGIDIYGTYGNDILNFTRVELESAGAYGFSSDYTNIGTEYFNNRWTSENPSNTYARAVIEDVNKNNRASDHFVEDGSYLRLRNIKLAYRLPSNVTEKMGLSNVKFYISAQNLITLTSYSGWDPEIGQVSDFDGNSNVQTRGIDSGVYPVTPNFTMGFNLNL